MVSSGKESYVGPEAILKHICKNQDKYEDKENINLDSLNISFIISTLKDFKLSKPHKRRVKGGSEYQHYPKKLVNQIGEHILEFDFVQRFIKGQTTNTTAANFGVYQDITVANNQDYQVNFYQQYATHTATAGTLKIEAYDNTTSAPLGSQSITTTGTALSYTSFRFTTEATTASVKIKVYLNAETNGIAYVDSISVKQSSKALADSSGNNNTGTINGASRTDTDGGQ